MSPVFCAMVRIKGSTQLGGWPAAPIPKEGKP